MKSGSAGAEHKGQLERLARRGTASAVGAGFSAVFGIALVVIVTNGFSPALAGTLFAATSVFLIIESIILLGIDTGLVRWLPAHLASGRAQDVRSTLRVALVPVLVLAVVGAAALFAAAPRLASAVVGGEQTESMTTLLRVLALALPIAAMHDSLQAATRGIGTMRPTVVVENIGRHSVQALAILIVYLAGAGALALGLAWSLPYALALAFTAAWLLLLLRRRVAAAGGPAEDWRLVAREFWRFTAPRAIARITQTALKRSDIVLVAALASPAEAALYTAATRFVVLGQLLVQAVQQALAPHLSALFAREDVGAARSIFQAATLWSMLAAWPIYLVSAGFAPTMMQIFGSGYESADEVVVILSLTMLFATACGPVDSVLLMAGRSWLSLFNNSVALLLNVTLNLVLIPQYGVNGAAISWAVAIVVRNVLPLTQVQRSMGMWPGTVASLYVAAGSLLCFGLTAAIARVAGLSPMPTVLLMAGGGAAYVVGIWLLRGPLHLQAFGSVLVRQRARQRRAAAAVD